MSFYSRMKIDTSAMSITQIKEAVVRYGASVTWEAYLRSRNPRLALQYFEILERNEIPLTPEEANWRLDALRPAPKRRGRPTNQALRDSMVLRDVSWFIDGPSKLSANKAILAAAELWRARKSKLTAGYIRKIWYREQARLAGRASY